MGGPKSSRGLYNSKAINDNEMNAGCIVENCETINSM